MATKLRMYYNPYLCTLKLAIVNANGIEEEIDGSAKDDIAARYSNRFCLEDDGDQLLQILTESYRGAKLIFEFVGTAENYLSFSKLCSKHPNVQLVQSSKQRILSCNEINEKIITKVRQLKSLGYDIDSHGEIDKILDATIPVVVVGNMSAGKSTFLNALIGEELLPSGQDATTGVICELHHSKNEVSVSFSTKDQKVVVDCVNIDNSNNFGAVPGELQSLLREPQKPIERIRRVIDFYNFKDKENGIDRTVTVDDKLMSICCPFFNAKIPEQIVFYDTPGGDSDSNSDDAETLEKALKDQTKGFLIFVCAERKDLDKSQKLIDTIQKATGNKLDLAHTIVVCNQTEVRPEIKVVTSTEKEWESRITYVSSAVALGARKPNSLNTEWKEGALAEVFEDHIDKFSNPNKQTYLSLPQYCTLPNTRKDGIESRHNELIDAIKVATDEEKAKRSLMQFNSGIDTVEQEIIYVANELFPYNQCERARRVFQELLEEYKETISKKEAEKEGQRLSRIAEFQEIYEPLCKDLSDFTDDYIVSVQNDFSKHFYKQDYAATLEKSGNFATHATDKFLTAESYSARTETEIRNSIADLLDKDLTNLTARAKQDFSDYLSETVLPDYTKKCKAQINSQSSLSESEKEVFRSFFTTKKLLDQTSAKRKKDVENVKLDLPKLREQISGDKWYSAVWKSIINAGKKVGYWLEKNLGKIKENLKFFYEKSFTEFSEDLIKQIKTQIAEIFEEIKNAFSDQSADDNIICDLNPELGDIKRAIQSLSKDIKELDNKKRRIADELTELNNIFSNVK